MVTDKAERIGFVPCDLHTGICGDVDSKFNLDPSYDTEDPRAFLYNNWYYNFYYSESPPVNCSGNLCTVKLAKTQTPLIADSWVPIRSFPWHRNGCCLMKPKGQRSYCIFGEGPGPLPGLGLAYTTDIDSGHFTQLEWIQGLQNDTNPLTADSQWILPLGASENEIKLEAGTPLVQLSTGDWVHFYAAATPGWVPNGNYTAGYIILDRDDPRKIIQRSTTHIMVPTFAYETLCNGSPGCPYQGERKNVIFLCSATPLPPPSQKDSFRLFFGGGDGNVGTAVVHISLDA